MATRIEFNNMNLGLMKHGLDRWFAHTFKQCKCEIEWIIVWNRNMAYVIK